MITPEESRPDATAQYFASYLAEASEVLASSLDYQATLTSLARLVVPRLADWCAIDILEEDGSINQLALTHKDPGKDAWGRELRRRYPPDPDAPRGVPSVLRSGKPEFYPEVTDEALVAAASNAEHLRIMREVGFTSVMILPLVARGRTLGAITLVTAESGRRYEAGDLAVAEDLARRAALAVDNARLYTEAQREIAERERTQEVRLRLSAIVESSDDAIIGKTLDGIIISWNEGAERIYGYSANETVGQPISMLVPPERPEEIPTILERIRRGEKVDHFETVRVTKDGRRLDISLTVSPIRNPAGEIVGASTIARDVTERRRTERQLQETEAQYRDIFEATGDGMVITDLDGNLVDANPAFCSMHGYDSREELVGHHATQWIHPDHHRLHKEYAAAIRAGGRFQAQRVDVRKDGTSFPVEVHGSAFTYQGKLHGLVVVRDITERVQAYELLERRVEERTRELSTLLEVSNDVASTLELEPLLGLILDQLRTVVDYTDSSLLVFEGEDLVTVGYRGPVPQEQIMGTRFSPGRGRMMWEAFGYLEPIIVDDVRSDASLARAYRQLVGEERLRREFRHIRSWMGVPMTLKGQPVGLLAIIHEEPGHYTERHAELARTIANQAAIAIENARLYERAQSAAALEERQRLARELHDSVSQALYGITLGSEVALTLLDRDPARASEPLQYVRSLAEAGLAEMRALIFELRPESLENEGLVAALEKQAASLRARYDISVRTAIHCQEPDVPMEAKEALYRIAQEALHNTVKHAQASSVELKLECGANGVTLGINDDGVGFDPAGSFPGHLGLKSMRERAMRLGGTLEVKSEPGKGSHLRARIPSGSR